MSTAPVVRRRREQKILVFNPSIYTDSVEVAGVTYHFPPRGFAHCVCADHNIKGEEDNVGVHQSYDWPRDSKNVLKTGGLREVAARGEMTADTVAEMIVSPACRGAKFFVIVEGTERERKATMQEAVRKWAEAHAADVDLEIQAWERECRELQLSQPGALPPRPPQRIKDGYEFRRSQRNNTSDREDFVCLTCGLDFSAKADLDQHIKDDHPGIAADRGLTAKPARAARTVAPLAERAAKTNAADAAAAEAEIEIPETPAGEGPGAEVAAAGEGDEPDPGEENDTGEIVMRRAERTGVNLSPADRRALSEDDPETIADVQKRIRDLRSQRQEHLKAELAARRKGAGATAPQA